MKNINSAILIMIFILSAFLIFQFIAQAQLEDIAFPVPELGNCASEDDCKAFCDKPGNFSPCIDFAEKHNLVSKEEAQRARQLAEAGITTGPGNCQGDAECDAYCSQPANMEECILFAEEHNLMPAEELTEAKQVLAALKQGANLPGGCTNKQSCETYCQEPTHIEECVTFAQAAGFMSQEEVEMIRKTGGQGPGGCRGKDVCENYCEEPNHFEECIAFAEEHDLINPEEARMARLTGGKGPGDCRGKEECEAYCNDISHMEECIDFGLKIGEISPEEAEQAKKMAALGITTGPGNCKGKDECEAFCNDPANMNECIDFAIQIGEISPEEAEQAKKMGPAMMAGGPGGCMDKEKCEAYCAEPANGEECMNFALEHGLMSQEELQRIQQMGQAMMGEEGGPGGCRSEEECGDYCDDPAHSEECLNFAVQIGQMSAEEAEALKQMMSGEGPGPENMPQMMHEGIPEEMMPPEGRPEEMGPQEEFQYPPEGQTQEQTQQQIEQEMQRQIEQEAQQQMEEQFMPAPEQSAPAPSEEPSPPLQEPMPAGARILSAFNSFWQKFLNFLGR